MGTYLFNYYYLCRYVERYLQYLHVPYLIFITLNSKVQTVRYLNSHYRGKKRPYLLASLSSPTSGSWTNLNGHRRKICTCRLALFLMGDLVQTWDLLSSGVEIKSGRKAEIIENSNIEIFSLQLVAMLQTLISYETLWYFKDVR